jgi:transcriptional regulator with XRE-family HTH domain
MLRKTKAEKAEAIERGDRLRSLRERLNESQGTFALRFGTGRTTILRWEAGGFPTYPPLVDHIERVCADIRKTLRR